MEKKTIKAGTIILMKKYRFWKKWWAKLTKKELLYNRAMLFTRDFFLKKEEHLNGDVVVYEPVKKYSEKECYALTVTDFVTQCIGIMIVDAKELAEKINSIRTNTFSKDFNFDELTYSKYYKKW